MNIKIIIPSYNPKDKLIDLVNELIKNNFENILIIDDGSDTESIKIYSKIPKKVKIIYHDKNMGKGCALKTGIATIKKEDAFKHVFKALDNLGKTIKSHKYKVITRCNIATGTKGDADGEYSGIYENSGELKTIRSFIKEMQSLEGIDIVGDDSYNATLKDNKGILMMYKNQLSDNYPHIAENDGNYQNTPSLLITSAVVNGGYLVYELATSPFFKKNNASDIDQGIYSVNADKTLTPKKHESSIKDALSILNLASTPLGLAKNGNILGFNLKTDSPLKVTNQTINSENISVNVNIDNSAIGYAVDYKNSLYLQTLLTVQILLPSLPEILR